jgi:hypothetical protein
MNQFKDHVRGARKAGLKEEELVELMIHVAHYAGWASGTGGQEIIRDVFNTRRRRKRDCLAIGHVLYQPRAMPSIESWQCPASVRTTTAKSSIQRANPSIG